jgi:hypothetical protein
MNEDETISDEEISIPSNLAAQDRGNDSIFRFK